MCQVVNDVELSFLDVGANGESQVYETCAASDEGIYVGQSGRILEHIFLWLDNIRFHFFRRRGAPEVGDRHLWFLDRRQQLNG